MGNGAVGPDPYQLHDCKSSIDLDPRRHRILFFPFLDAASQMGLCTNPLTKAQSDENGNRTLFFGQCPSIFIEAGKVDQITGSIWIRINNSRTTLDWISAIAPIWGNPIDPH